MICLITLMTEIYIFSDDDIIYLFRMAQLNTVYIKVKKRQQFSLMHLKEFTLANHLHLQSNFSP